MRLTAKTDKGKVRTENQDDYRAAIQCAGYAWAAVCDGMGGAAGGTTASGIAATLAEERCTALHLEGCTPEQVQLEIHRLVQDANTLVYERSLQEPLLYGMGTTMVVAMVTGRVCTIAAVGDSRAYLYRDGRLRQITRDHSMVQELVEKGVITQQEADTHPQKNVITRAVGIQPQVEVDLFEVPLQPQDMLLLCTDGLTNALRIEQIEGILADTAFYDSTGCLMDQVLEKDEQDNTTVVLLSVD